jgi:hypothetical protein
VSGITVLARLLDLWELQSEEGGGGGEEFSFLCEIKFDFCVNERAPVDSTRILKYCEFRWLFTPYFFGLYFDIITRTHQNFQVFPFLSLVINIFSAFFISSVTYPILLYFVAVTNISEERK